MAHDEELDAILNDALGIDEGHARHAKHAATAKTVSRKPRVIPPVEERFQTLSGCATMLGVSAALTLLGGIIGAVMLLMRGEILSAVACFLSADFTALLLFAAGHAATCLVQTERNTRQASALLDDLRSVA